MSSSDNKTYAVNILGAGVSGLSTGLALLEKGNYSVKIIATHLPSDLHIDYTSPWAGAHWRSFADIADLEQQELEEATYKRFEHLAETEPKAGIMFLTGHDYWDVKPKNFEEPWFSRFLKNYRHIPKEELPSGVDFGTTYTTVSINTPKYLRYLQDQILARGGIIEHGTVQSLRALAQVPHSDKHPKADIIVNCSGLGSRNLQGVNDHQMFPTRGQILIVKVPDEIWPKAKQFTMERYAEGSAFGVGTVTYVIPRDNGEIILGGTTDHWDYQEAPSEKTAKAIMQRVQDCRPDLFSKATVLRNCVGLRPNRRGGVRVSATAEQLDWNEGWNPSVLVVAHNYGHAGFGYQASIGCANKTAKCIERSLKNLQTLRDEARTMAKL
ncbi:hypothetical protein BCR41DRAFT_422221 [Lobosporangium transversale]|uniref:FAD dependent oxidoreductase domain-containing protein n=1 Tax=Lobosporangium transversale TaxID=64571 RepID=A0A1Y2GRF2_9FUNG|nr:hypothetical protein BCR41DRAFT_422221 [Lobosporangium transversale]ORZ15422.1 hypothetical protein BCR41DRAFT_422221 [Lobosporangium transversale]|eukprot:XP_021881170.1 hypothetical protein BCR41DRAFT_422221 [Lobosporangium transversale]